MLQVLVVVVARHYSQSVRPCARANSMVSLSSRHYLNVLEQLSVDTETSTV